MSGPSRNLTVANTAIITIGFIFTNLNEAMPDLPALWIE